MQHARIHHLRRAYASGGLRVGEVLPVIEKTAGPEPHTRDRALRPSRQRSAKVCRQSNHIANCPSEPPRVSRRLPNRLLGAATLDRLRHGAYRLTLEGESYRSPRPMSERRKSTVATGGNQRNNHPVRGPDQHPSVAPLTRTWVATLGRPATNPARFIGTYTTCWDTTKVERTRLGNFAVLEFSN